MHLQYYYYYYVRLLLGASSGNQRVRNIRKKVTEERSQSRNTILSLERHSYKVDDYEKKRFSWVSDHTFYAPFN